MSRSFSADTVFISGPRAQIFESWKSAEWNQVDRPAEPDLGHFKKEYDELIYSFHCSLGHRPSYWFTPLSSREWYASELQSGFQMYARWNSHLQKGNGPFYVSVSSWFQLGLVWKLAKEKGLRSKTALSLIGWLVISSCRELVRRQYLSLRLWLGLLITIIRNGYSEQLLIKEIGSYDRILLSPIHGVDIDSQVDRSHYFGELPFSSNAGSTLLVGPPDHIGRQPFLEKKGVSIRSIYSFLHLRDLPAITLVCFRELFNPPRKRLDRDSPFISFQRRANTEIRDFIYNRIIGSVQLLAIRRIFRHTPCRRILHTYENNWWERAIAIQAKDFGKETFGFLHCAILESHRKFRLIKDEWSRKPGPDFIVVTGPEARDLLLKMGAYPANKILSGFDFRGPSLSSIISATNVAAGNRTTPEKSHATVLILLEGLATMAELLQIVLDSMDSFPEARFIVRAHPVYPLDMPAFNSIRSHTNYSRLKVSEGLSLPEDLARADVCIYKGSTAALYGAYAGLPLLKFRGDWWYSDDPLFFSEDLKESFCNLAELKEKLEKYLDPQKVYDSGAVTRRKEKVERYIRAPSQDDHRKFLRDYGSLTAG